jgi:two-component system cell cycle sensor histidine kinase/response regulator CckA
MSTDHQIGNGASHKTPTGEALRASELSYRRLFEAAQDGILILELGTGRITDVNPFLSKLLGFSHSEMMGRTVGELSPFKDMESNQVMLERLQRHGYVRYEDLPLETSDGRHIAVEFVSNVYQAGDKKVIQCNIRDITQRKKSEQELRLMNTCVANLNDIVLVTEADPINEPGPKIVFVNAAFERITGYAPSEALGRSPRFLQGKKTNRHVLKEIHEALAMAQPIRRQVINYKKDGTEYWMDIDVVPIFDSAGKCTHFAAIERDITESKKVKESLKLFRALMDRSPDAIEVVDPETGRFLDVNETACRRLGYSREEMLKLSIPDVLETGDIPFSSQAALEEVRRTGVRTIETRHRRKDGSTFPVEINTQYVELDQAYLLAVVRDITDRREMEQTLKESEAKFRTLFEVANDANFILHNGVFVDCNAKALEFFGVSREELMGQPPTLFSPALQPDGRDSQVKAREYIEKALGGEPQFFEWVNQRPDGRVINADVTLNRFELCGKIYIQTIVRDITERKEVEKQLLWKTAFFEAQVHSALDGILIVDVEGKKVLQNQRMLELWNIPPEFADELDDNRQRDWVANQTKDGQQFIDRVQYLYAHPDEISREEIDLINGKCFDRYSAPVLGRDGKYYGRIWSFRDVTERKHADEKQRASEERYRTLFDYAPDGIVIANPEGTYIDANASMCRMLGYNRDELIGRSASDIVAQSEIPKIAGALNEIKEESFHHQEWQFRRKDGLLFPAEVIVTPMPDGNLLGMIRDTSERKRAEEQITEQATFLDKAQDAIFVRDLEGKMLFWNKGAERMYGWTRQEVLSRKMDNLLYAHPKELKEAYRVTMSQGDWHGELQHFTKDGDELMIESRWTLIRDNEGLAKSVLAINTDITEKKMIEAQFMRAQRMESIGTLAGGIAHDLNNILAPIMMSIELLKETSTDAMSANILKTIEVSAKRGADIVRQVLSFARGLEGERVEVQLKHLLTEVQSIIKDTFPKDIRLEFSIPNDIWTILGDPTQVHQILLNLCVNARDAMPHGGSLSVNVENCVLDEHYATMNLQAKAGRYVQISIADTGTGIPPTLLEKIFEPFFTTKAINKGTGLGLSTVMAIVKSHGGLINVYSEPNKGTTFKVYLPALEMSSEARKEQLALASLPRGNGETILLVDDEASIITITTQTLLAFGYHVLTATDGAEAVAVYAERKNDIAVVLTDMAMPIMDGAATIRALTKMNPRLKIIAASGLHANADMTKASGVGIKHFLTKPYTAGTLLKAMRTILDEA